MVIANILTKDDLKEPYDRLVDTLELEDILKVEQLYGGRQMKLKRNCTDVEAEYPELAIMLGATKAQKVLRALGGDWTYFPTIRRSASSAIRKAMLADFNGYNLSTVAKTYGYTERHARRIIGSGGKAKNTSVLDGQLTLLDI